MLNLETMLEAGYIEVKDHDPYDYCPIKDGIPASTNKVPKLKGDGIEGQILQFDNLANKYIESKKNAREILGVTKLYQKTLGYSVERERALVDFLLEKMTTEYPDRFTIIKDKQVWTLVSWTGDSIEWHPGNMKLYPGQAWHSVTDALCLQIQEDVVMMSMVDGVPTASMIHIHHPNGFPTANHHIGLSFAQIHEDVRHRNEQLVIQKPDSVASIFCQSNVSLERVGAIGFRGNTILCRHPDDAQFYSSTDRFDIQNPLCFNRFERQTITGLPEVSSFIFTIKTYFCDVLAPHRKDQMRKAFSNIHTDAFAKKYLDLYANDIKATLNHYSEADVDFFLEKNSRLMDMLGPE